MSTERKGDAISEQRLQEVIDKLKQRYIRERGDEFVHDAVLGLVELQVLRDTFAKLRRIA